MCGIAGSFGPVPVGAERVAPCLALMKNRGPNANGVWRGQTAGRHIVLLHSRLAIVGLSPDGNQPFIAGDISLVFNGEIYNHVELRIELETKGHVFRTRTDTEVVAEAYRAWGPACVERFEGMWAFALFDGASGKLMMSRDRFGEKPLFYSHIAGQLFFASEIKFLTTLSGVAPTPDTTMVSRFLVNGYKSLYKAPRSFYRDIRELPAGCNAVLDNPVDVSATRYWQLRYAPQAITEADALAQIRQLLRRAVELRMRADVPVAFCLSGGVDSAVLASIAVRELGSDIATYSIVDDDPRYDERDNIVKVVDSLGCKSTEIHAGAGDFFERLNKLVHYHDAPVATISYYVHSYLSEAIAGDGFKVAISGTAADEIFTGYFDHYLMWLAHMRDNPDHPTLVKDWRAGYGSAVRNPLLQDPDRFVNEPGMRTHIYDNASTFRALMRKDFSEGFAESTYADDVLRNRMMNELFHESVPVILKEDDLNSMMFSVENRAPFLDRELVEFLYTVPTELLMANGCPKWLLRRAVDGLVPDDVLYDRRKRGFNASIDTVMDRSDPDTRARLLEPGPIFDIVDRDRMETLVDGDLTDNSLSKFMFSFVSTRAFMEHSAEIVNTPQTAVA
jgi:asparagine synthase (glutamine-hydrolysing)